MAKKNTNADSNDDKHNGKQGHFTLVKQDGSLVHRPNYSCWGCERVQEAGLASCVVSVAGKEISVFLGTCCGAH
jgi:hypothetical protein